MRTLALLFALPAFAFAQPREIAPMPRQVFPGEAMIEAYFHTQAKQLADNCLNDLTTKEAWEKRRPELRRQFLEMMGLDPLPARTDLKATITGTVQGDGYTVEKLHFQSIPGLYVTANFYLPKPPVAHAPGSPKKLPTILYVCGHGNVVENKVSYGSKVHYQYHPAWFAKNGYACLILDTLELGEIPGDHHGTHSRGAWWWQTRGYTPAGIELWNAMRAIDYLETRSEVDAKKIGVTGRSGGGATSWWLVAADDRPACYAPVAGIVDMQAHLCEGESPRLKKGVIAGHCDCMYMVNKYRWDFPMVAALAAPRPVLLGNTDADDIFPVAGYRRLADKVEKVYALYTNPKRERGPGGQEDTNPKRERGPGGQEDTNPKRERGPGGQEDTNPKRERGEDDRFQLLEEKGPHKDSPELRRGINRWMNRWLKGQPDLPIDDELPAKLTPQQLKVFAKLPEDAINATIHETWIKPAVIELPKSAEVAKAWWPEKRKELMNGLESEVFAGWPKDLDAVLKDAETAPDGADRLKSYSAYFESPGIATFNYFDPGSLTEHSNKIGIEVESLKYTPNTHVLRRYPLIGLTYDSWRVLEVRKAIRGVHWAKNKFRAPIRMTAKGDAASIALYAALFEDVDELVLEDLPATVRDGPILLNVAKVLDMPQAVALAASKVKSVHLKVKTEKDKAAWQWPAELQRLTGEKSLTITVVGQ
jgi:dienelactone hydrolase